MNKQSFTQKYKTATALIKSHKADGILLISPANRFWFTGVETEFGICLITTKCSKLFVDNRDFEHCKKTISFLDVCLYTNIKEVREVIKKLKVKRLLIESDYVTLSMLDNIIKPLGIKPLPIVLSSLRIVKTKEEIKLMQKAANIAADAMEHIKSWVKVGVTELRTKKELSKKMLDLGATKNSFDLIVAFGENSAIPHHQSTERKLRSSEFIKIDIGCVYKGYCSDITRTFWSGKPSKKMLEIYQIVLEANKLGIKNAKAGITGSELDNVCRSYIKNTKYSDKFVHRTGHGLGIEIHELPNVKPNYNLPLPANSVVTIEPGIYIPGFGGVRIEDSVVIKKDKAIVLTNKSKK